jgi:hypothetical protein
MLRQELLCERHAPKANYIPSAQRRKKSPSGAVGIKDEIDISSLQAIANFGLIKCEFNFLNEHLMARGIAVS